MLTKFKLLRITMIRRTLNWKIKNITHESMNKFGDNLENLEKLAGWQERKN